MEITIPIIIGILYLGYHMRSEVARINFKRIIRENIKFSWTKQSGFKEILIFISFLVFYKISRFVAIGDESTAFINAYRVIEWEKMMGIYYEIPIQQWFLDKTALIKFLNEIYIRLHVPSMVLFFIWLYRNYREFYFYIRNGFMMANVFTLFFFIGFPCAPPRMLTDAGFVDTLLIISGVNIYSGNLSYLFNQYAAMPSMHYGTALLIGVVTACLAKNMFIRIGIFIYPTFVLLVIVATANHFFLDAIVGGLCVVAGYMLMPLFSKKYKFSNLKNLAQRSNYKPPTLKGMIDVLKGV